MTDKRQIPNREYTGIENPESEGQRRKRASEDMREAVALANTEARSDFNERRLERSEKNIENLVTAFRNLENTARAENAELIAFRNFAVPMIEKLVTRQEFVPVQWISYGIACAMACGLIISFLIRK